MNQFMVGESGTAGGIETALRIADLDGWDDVRVADGIVASLWWGQHHQRSATGNITNPRPDEVEFLSNLQRELSEGYILSSDLERRRVQKAIDSYSSGVKVRWSKRAGSGNLDSGISGVSA